MKKNLLYLLALVCTFNFFVACSDDDDDNKNGEDSLKTASYSGDALILKLNGESVSGATVKVEVKTETTGVTTLSVIPGQSSVNVNTEIEKTDEKKYDVKGSLKEDYYEVSLDGNINDGVLTLNVTFKVTSELVGKWNYKEMYLNIETADGTIILDEQQGPIPVEYAIAGMKQQFAGYLSHLTSVSFKDNAWLDVQYTPMESEEVVDLNNLTIYNISKDKVGLLLGDFSGIVKSESTKDVGPSIPDYLYVNYNLDDDLTLFVDKNFVTSITNLWSLFEGLLGDKAEVAEQYITSIVTIARQATVFEFGVVLED